MNEAIPNLKLKEKLSYAFTNTGQTIIYAFFTVYLLNYATDYLKIVPAVAGVIVGATRIFDAINDPLMGQILDRTNTRWGKCKPYMLFTPIPLALLTMLMFAPFNLTGVGAIVFLSILYVVFTMVYTANDIPYWSMSAIITTDPKERVSVVTMTRLIGGMGSAITIGGFWFVANYFIKSGAGERRGIFFAVIIFAIVGTILLLQGFFNTRERAKHTSSGESIFANLKLIPKSKSLVINIIAGIIVSIAYVGSTAMLTYFVKWNIKELYPNLDAYTVLSRFTPIIGILPAIASVVGLLLAPVLLKRFEKKQLMIYGGIFSAVINLIFYFVGYPNIYIFIIGRFFAFLPLGVWAVVITLMFGDSVDEIELKTGKRVEGTCFSLLTFIGKFQNGVNVAITGFILSYVGYNVDLDPMVSQQSPEALHGIFIMVTLVSALGFFLTTIPFFFYDFDKKKHQEVLEALESRKYEEAINEQ